MSRKQGVPLRDRGVLLRDTFEVHASGILIYRLHTTLDSLLEVAQLGAVRLGDFDKFLDGPALLCRRVL